MGEAWDLAVQSEPVAWAYDYLHQGNWVPHIALSEPTTSACVRGVRPIYAASTASRLAVNEEAIARVIDAGDFGYSINLKSLTEEGRIYTLDLGDGSELREFSDIEAARDVARRHWSLMRARAVLVLLGIPQFGDVTDAARDLLSERRRQIAKGWTPEHDDMHVDGSIGMAAACYAAPRQIGTGIHYEGVHGGPPKLMPAWPWLEPRKVPHDRMGSTLSRRDELVIAGALILAEIERLDRKGSEE